MSEIGKGNENEPGGRYLNDKPWERVKPSGVEQVRFQNSCLFRFHENLLRQSFFAWSNSP